MLSRSASPAHICLSCQLRILRRSSAIFLSTAKEAESPQLRTKRARHSQFRQFSSTRLNRLKISHEYEPSPNDKHENGGPPIRFASKDEPGGRIHGRAGQEVREETRSLGVNTLGAPSDVIVLKDARKDWFWPPKQAPPILPPEGSIDLLAAIEAERGLVAQSEVDANIEDHKPKNPGVPLSAREFLRIRQTMEDGFTIQQLQRYVRGYLAKEAEHEQIHDPKAQARKGKKDWRSRAAHSGPSSLLSKTSWYPDITEDQETFQEHPLRGYSTIQHTTKQTLVLHVLRTCWKLDVREVVESAGQIELRIKRQEFEFLTNSNPTPLEPIISRLRNEDSERIEAFRSQGVLRITANRERAVKIAEDIEKIILNRIQKVEVNISHLMELRKAKNGAHEALDNRAIREVAKMTGTSIVRRSAKTATIYCVNDSPVSGPAPPAEVARRLLISYFTDFDKQPTRLGLQTPCSSHAEALVRCDDLECLPWYDRLRKWVRRTSAARKGHRSDAEVYSEKGTTTPTSFEKEDTATVGGIPDRVSSELFEPVRKQRNIREPDSRYWSEKHQRSSTIIIGQVLHEKPDAKPIELVSGKRNAVASDHQTFSSTVPNLFNFLERLKPKGKGPLVNNSVVMRFEPSPLSADGSKGLRNYKAFPSIEMMFGIEEVDSVTRKLFLKDMYAIAHTSTSDVMIPERPVDLRFHQRTVSKILSLRYRHMIPAQISEFLVASQLNLVTGIKTPAHLILPIDAHLCREPRAWKGNPGDDSVMDVGYLFSGMDIKKRTEFEFNGWTLIYTDISSGKAGGKRRELRLIPTSTRSKVSRSELNQGDFIKAAFELVDAIGQSQNGEVPPPSTGEIQWYFPRVRTFESRPEPEVRYFEKRLVFAADDGKDSGVEEDAGHESQEI